MTTALEGTVSQRRAAQRWLQRDFENFMKEGGVDDPWMYGEGDTAYDNRAAQYELPKMPKAGTSLTRKQAEDWERQFFAEEAAEWGTGDSSPYYGDQLDIFKVRAELAALNKARTSGRVMGFYWPWDDKITIKQGTEITVPLDVAVALVEG